MENRIKRKLGMTSSCFRDGTITEVDTLDLIKNVGFECFFTPTDDCEKVKALVERGDKLGLTCEFVHASFNNINAMWLPGLDYLTVFNDMKKAVDTCAANDIPMIITHVSSGWLPPQVNDLGLERYDEIVLYAKDKGIQVAFENLRKVGNLAVLVDRYENMDNVGFCYDNGHEHCYTETVCWPDIFREKMLCTHIHDNFGRPEDKMADGDIHILPFDGNCDYAKMMAKLDEYNYTGSLTLEVGRYGRYKDLSHEEFLQTCYDRLVKISKM